MKRRAGYPMVMRSILLLVLAGAQAACVNSTMINRRADCVQAERLPTVEELPDGQSRTRLSVLIYNVEGLPWPARRNRKPSLDMIGDTLQTMRARGSGPDVVMLQEAFTPDARDVLTRAGYANIVSGPARRARRDLDAADVDPQFRKARRRNKGERFGRLLNSGLYIASDLPLELISAQPFSRRACAGFDCLANKGGLAVELRLPGMPGGLVLFTTHLNSQRAARVSLERAREAHGYQLEENALMIDVAREAGAPLIMGGDFNMRGDPARFEAFAKLKPYSIVHRFCIERPDICAARMSFDGDAPWMDTQDLQAFDSGTEVRVRPVEIAAMFDGLRGERLSDHDGVIVTYELRWSSRSRMSGAQRPLCSGPRSTLSRRQREEG